MLVAAELASSTERCVDQSHRSDNRVRCMPVAYKLAFAGLAVVGLAGVANADVTLGVLVPASGKGASYGIQQQSAIEMFMERYADLGKSGKLKLITYDTRGENTEAINLTRKLISTDNVLAVVGPQFSAEAEVAFPLGVRGETPILTPMAAKPGIATANRPWAFRFALTSENDYRPLLEAWLKRQPKPIAKVVILHDAKDAVSSFDGKTVFPMLLKERGIEVLDTISFQTGDIDYSGQVTKAKALSPDGIVVSALYNEAGHVTRELRKQGMNQPIVAGVGVNDPRFIQLAGPAAEGVMAAFDFFAENPNPAVAAWVGEFYESSARLAKHTENVSAGSARVGGVESEMELSFAALHQLLRPGLAGADELPPPQRTALRLAFGLEDGAPPDGFLVGLAALGLLAARAAARPLLCLVDDAHWLDHESAAALAFAARRLYADSIAIVFAVREPAPAPGRLAGVPELRLAGLAEEDARALLAAAAGARLGRPLADHVIAETGGNPLALIEIGRELASGGLDGDPFLPGPVPLGRRLEQRYLREVRELPAATI